MFAWRHGDSATAFVQGNLLSFRVEEFDGRLEQTGLAPIRLIVLVMALVAAAALVDVVRAVRDRKDGTFGCGDSSIESSGSRTGAASLFRAFEEQAKA